MDILSVFKLLGGLAFFLFGMNTMGDALEKQAGGKLKTILEKLTSNPLKGILLGLVVTAVIQSSSATTVMVVGFVNSGVMQLRQAIGIIMGANIGTTVTAWILSLTGIEGDSLLMTLLKPTSFSPLLAFAGIVMIMFGKNDRKKDLGKGLIGFAILMYGMDMMSAAVKPLAKVPEFQNILVMFKNPILGILTGALLTAIIQSSSASVGILQALSATGAVSFGAAIPIIMGQNIGTCVTAMISSVGTSKNAKRAALVHLYFNMLGTAFCTVVFYGLNAVLHFSFVDSPIDQSGIAVVHTTFNIACTLVMIPLMNVLEKLAVATVKEGAPEREFALLEERFLATPSFAIDQSKKVCDQMALLTRESVQTALALSDSYDPKQAEHLREMEGKIDRYEDKLGSYLINLSGKSLSLQDSRKMSKQLHTISDFERISDYTVSILVSVEELKRKNLSFSPAARHSLNVISRAITELLDLTVMAFVHDDMDAAAKIEPLDHIIGKLNTKLKNDHVERLKTGECTIEMGFVLNDIQNSFERISGHCSNVGVCVIEVNRGSFDTHAYLGDIKTGSESYRQNVDYFRQKYNF